MNTIDLKIIQRIQSATHRSKIIVMGCALENKPKQIGPVCGQLLHHS
ncbi:hypothetical protein NAC44_00155 [Allorhizobium sp. BGMRC 0089]|nr:hypothetical protein [Allorhizobium sonneratiae]MCM2290737.1 hypothetical protein [Allorhizobium sonneratiae]